MPDRPAPPPPAPPLAAERAAHPPPLPGETAAETAFRLRARAWWAANGTPRPAAGAAAAAAWQPGYEGDARDALARARAFQRALAEAGLAGITVPVELGGAGLGVREQLIALDESEPYEDPTAHLMIGLGMCVPTLVAHGSDDQRRRHVPALLRADEVWCQLFSEPGAGSDLAGLQTRAVRDGGDWVVDGQKVWTSGAQFSERGILLARTDPDVPKHAGMTMFVCDMHRPGITVRPLRQMTGTSGFNEVFLDGVRLPADAVVGEVGAGWHVARTTLMNERVAVGAGRSNVPGVPAAVLVALARERGLDRDPVLRQRLADAHVHEVVLGWMGQRVRAAVRAGRAPGPEASVAKVATSAHARRTTDLAVAIAGVGALAWDRGVGDDRWARALDAAPGQAIGGGTSEILRSLAGERVLGLPPRAAGLSGPRDPARRRRSVPAVASTGNDCTFCRVVAGELAVAEVAREGGIVAFLDHRPVFPGHVLVVPVDHHEVLADLPAADVGPYFTAVQRMAVAVERGCGAQGTFVAMNNRVSQSVPHLHTHVVPRTKGDGLRGFFWPRTKYADAAAMADVAAAIAAAYRAAGEAA